MDKMLLSNTFSHTNLLNVFKTLKASIICFAWIALSELQILDILQMVWCTGKKSKEIANLTTTPGGGHITGHAPLILKSPLTLCWLSRLTRTLVLGWQYHAGYHSRETHWEATLRLRYCGLYYRLFRLLFRNLDSNWSANILISATGYEFSRGCHWFKMFSRAAHHEVIVTLCFPALPLVTGSVDFSILT